MSIATRLEAINQHLLDDYSVLTLAGADLTNVDKNIVNLNPTWKERLLYFINNGTDEVYDNWDKVTGEGTEISLNNTLEAKMKIAYKGNTYQYSTSGKNLLNLNDFVPATSGSTITQSDKGIEITSVSGGYGAKIVINNLQTNTDYYVSYNYTNISGDTRNQVTVYASTTQTTSIGSGSNTNGFTFNTGSNTTINIWFYTGFGTVSKAKYTDIQMELGTSKTSWEEYTNGASPNPDYPQDIQVVSGDNSIEVCGKNLFNKSAITNGYYYNPNGEYVSVNSTYISDYIPVSQNETLSFQTNETTSTKRVNYFDSNKTWLSQVNTANANYTFTTPSNTKYIRVSFNDLVNKDTIQIEKGSTATTYAPYVSQTYPINLPEGIELCKIGDYQDKIDKSSGENLFDVGIRDGVVIASGYESSTQRICTNDFIKVKPNTTYTLSFNTTNNINEAVFSYFSSNAFPRSDSSGWVSNMTITTPNNCNYIQISFRNSNNINITTSDISNIMLNEGSTALPYEPYGTSWYLKKEIGKYDLGTLNYTINNHATYGTYFYANISGVLMQGAYQSITYQSLCTDYIVASRYPTSFLNYTYCFDGSGTNVNQIQIKNSDYDNASSFKTSLDGVLMYVPLETPAYILLNNTLQHQLDDIYNWVKSYSGQTNISQTNNDLASVLNASALQEM